MEQFAQLVVRRRWFFVIGWIVALVVVGAISGGAGTDYKDSFNLKGTESATAYNILGGAFRGANGDTDQIVYHVSGDAKLTDSAVRAKIEASLAAIRTMPHVESINSPFGAAGAAQLATSGQIGFAKVNFDEASPPLPNDAVQNVMDEAQKASGHGLGVAEGGQGVQQAEQAKQGGDIGEIIGVIVAFFVMWIAFGSFLAALLPLITALFALGLGISVDGLLTHVMTIASFGPQLAALIGLGVGVDYSLFIVTRHRANLMRGTSVPESIPISLQTAGRAVMFAGAIVCIALLGMFLLGVSFLYGVAVSAALVVLFTIIASVTLLPALLTLFGTRILTRRTRRRIAAQTDSENANADVSPGWLRWGRMIQRRPVIFALLSAIVLIVIAIPTHSLRLGSSDAGNDPKSQTSRVAYDWLATGFGPGYNGTFQLVAKINDSSDRATFAKVQQAVSHTKDVASAGAPIYSPDGRVGIITMYPSSSPQDKATSDLLHQLRDHTIPDVTRGTSTTVYVGGITAIFADFSHVLAGKLPLFIGIVVLLSMILLGMVFRSLLIPLVAALMNLLAIGASFGVVVAVFQYAWWGSLTTIDRGGPIEAFVPVLMFAILFGLSMDYEVFLVSRMHEEWIARRDNHEAVTIGQAETGRVITAAGLIMIVVFGSFVTGGQRVIELFGIALATAVLFDAMIIRTMLVPALMHLFGDANWFFPKWLDRALPNLSIERGEVRNHTPDPAAAEPNIPAGKA